MVTRITPTLIVCILYSTVAAETSSEFDWPQWQGPNRDAVSNEQGLMKTWPESGPPLAWRLENLGGGYSAPAISRGKIYGMSNRGNDEVVWALSEKDGQEIWSTKLGPAVKQGMRQGIEGPGCTPTVDGNRLYVIGAGGNVACLQTDGGNIVWQRNMVADFGGRLPTWRYNESPLVDGDKIICTPGGPSATLVALNKQTGAVIWVNAPEGSKPEEKADESTATKSGENKTVQNEKPTVLVPAGSTWKYLDTGESPSQDWTTVDFNDSEWATGEAQLGYGDRDEKTRINDAPEGYPTYYFRKTFNVSEAGKLKPLVARLIKDDGAVIYLNGTEVCRDNMPKGIINRKTFADGTTEIENEFYLHEVKQKLVSGRNVVAVEVHQASANSSDVSFDLELRERHSNDRVGYSPSARQRGRARRGGSGAGYSSAIAIDAAGKRQYVQLTATALVGVDATNGKTLWKYDRPANRNRINCSTPLYHDGLLFASSAYGNGGGAIQLEKNADGTIDATEVYFTNRMQNHHGGMIVHDGCLYGANGGNGGGFLACLDFKSGEVLWRDRKAKKGSLAMAGDRLYLYTENGSIILIEPNRKEFVERGRFEQPNRSESPAWTHPVIANGKLYIRDQNLLLCYDVKAN